MINYINAVLTIKKVKKDLKTMSFDDSKDFCVGYNETPDSFEFYCGKVCGSIYNKNGRPVLKKAACFSVYDSDHAVNGLAFHGTQAEILIKALNELKEIYQEKFSTLEKQYKIEGLITFEEFLTSVESLLKDYRKNKKELLK